jgi:hypothetical protein
MLLTIADIKANHRQDWDALSEKQSMFVTEWVAGIAVNGKKAPVEACKVAYPNVTNAAAWAGRLMNNPRIARIVQLHFGMSPVQVTLFEVNKLIKRSRRKGSRLELLVAPWMKVAAALEALVARESR